MGLTNIGLVTYSPFFSLLAFISVVQDGQVETVTLSNSLDQRCSFQLDIFSVTLAKTARVLTLARVFK